jgi:hypothetical protein
LAIIGLVLGYFGVAIGVGVLAVGVPNYIRVRQVANQNFCINNLRMIVLAKQEWASRNNKQPTDVPTDSDVQPFILGAPSMFPSCLQGGHYTIGAVGEQPKCSIHGQIPD